MNKDIPRCKTGEISETLMLKEWQVWQMKILNKK